MYTLNVKKYKREKRIEYIVKFLESNVRILVGVCQAIVLLVLLLAMFWGVYFIKG